MTSSDIIRQMALGMRQARQRKNDRQKDLAARMGVSRLTVMKMEKGDSGAARVPLATWLKAAAHLDLLLTWTEVMQTQDDPFEIYDRKVQQQEKIRRGRVKKTSPS